MGCKARMVAFVAVVGWVATLFIVGCAVEVPKSALPVFRLTPPAEATSTPNPDTNKPIMPSTRR